MFKSFHGRTLATLTATGQDKVKAGFEPLPAGFKHVHFNDIDAARNAVTDKTVAIMLEPIQGEGGVNVADKGYMHALRELCDRKDLLLILDEVQTGMGRTGEMFAFRHYDIQPDVMTLAKSLGGGMPIGAVVAAAKVADVLTPGSHAATFGGSPIACAAALAVFEAIEKGDLIENTVKMGKYIVSKLEEIKARNPVIRKVKGKGLMIGVELDMEDAAQAANECMKKGLLINCTQKNVLRIMPPMTVREKEIDRAMSILGKVLESVL
jgi:acetylornithine/succinyldiaminopimelate/putrescine aminotransferase